MLLKSKKEKIVKDIEKIAEDSTSVVFVNFHGLDVASETNLRRSLRDNGVGYKVARKTLLKKALLGKADGEMPELSGEVAIAYSKDQTAGAREIYSFGKSNQGVMKILGGIFEGKFISANEMNEIATIPSREVLLSKIAFLLKSPLQRIAIAVNEVAKSRS